jgi:uncharacterized membrane protein (UPF0136 family)
MYMVTVTYIYAVLLFILGIVGYFASGRASITALIPAFFGIVLFVLGLLGRGEKTRRWVIGAAIVLAIVGFFATVSGLYDLTAMLDNGQVARPGAVISRSVMSVLSLAYLGVAIGSALSSRRESLRDIH